MICSYLLYITITINIWMKSFSSGSELTHAPTLKGMSCYEIYLLVLYSIITCLNRARFYEESQINIFSQISTNQITWNRRLSDKIKHLRKYQFEIFVHKTQAWTHRWQVKACTYICLTLTRPAKKSSFILKNLNFKKDTDSKMFHLFWHENISNEKDENCQ